MYNYMYNFSNTLMVYTCQSAFLVTVSQRTFTGSKCKAPNSKHNMRFISISSRTTYFMWQVSRHLLEG